MTQAYRVIIYSERGLNAYDKLKAVPNWRERRVMSYLEPYLFREQEEVTRGTLPFIVRVECLNNYVAKKIGFPDIIKKAYLQLGCEEGEGKDFEVVPCRAPSI